jgi:hypothetical protein
LFIWAKELGPLLASYLCCDESCRIIGWVGRLKEQWDTDGPQIKTMYRGLRGYRGKLYLAAGLGGCKTTLLLHVY